MRSEANNNPDLSEEKLDSICNRVTTVLDGIGIFQRRFFPPEFPELRKDLSHTYPREENDSILQWFTAVNRAGSHIPPKDTFK